jgi:hypothetical protein
MRLPLARQGGERQPPGQPPDLTPARKARAPHARAPEDARVCANHVALGGRPPRRTRLGSGVPIPVRHRRRDGRGDAPAIRRSVSGRAARSRRGTGAGGSLVRVLHVRRRRLRRVPDPTHHNRLDALPVVAGPCAAQRVVDFGRFSAVRVAGGERASTWVGHGGRQRDRGPAAGTRRGRSDPRPLDELAGACGPTYRPRPAPPPAPTPAARLGPSSCVASSPSTSSPVRTAAVHAA